MWLMLQQKKPDDYVIATGKQYSIKDFINLVAKELKIKIYWKRNKFKREFAVDEKNNVIVETDKRYFRPSEVENLLGDASKARKKLKWSTKINIRKLVEEMVAEEIKKN